MLPAHPWICAGALLLGRTPLAPSSTSSAACRWAESSTSFWHPWAWLSTSTINIVEHRMGGFEKRDLLMNCYNCLLFMLIAKCVFLLWIPALCLTYSPFTHWSVFSSNLKPRIRSNKHVCFQLQKGLLQKLSQMVLQGKLNYYCLFLYWINVFNILKEFSINVRFWYMPRTRT